MVSCSSCWFFLASSSTLSSVSSRDCWTTLSSMLCPSCQCVCVCVCECVCVCMRGEVAYHRPWCTYCACMHQSVYTSKREGVWNCQLMCIGNGNLVQALREMLRETCNFKMYGCGGSMNHVAHNRHAFYSCCMVYHTHTFEVLSPRSMHTTCSRQKRGRYKI